VDAPAPSPAAPATRTEAPASVATAAAPAATEAAAPAAAASWWTVRRIAGVGAAGTGGASLVVSAVFGAESNSAAGRAAALRGGSPTCSSNCGALESAYNKENTDATVSRVLLGLGLGAVAAGAALVLWPASEPQRAMAVVPLSDA